MLKMFLFYFAMLMGISHAYKHIVLMHGLNDGPSVFKTMKKWIEMEHPGTNVSLLDVDSGSLSLNPLWSQAKDVKKVLIPIMEDHPEGIHVLGYSQGGLLMRGVIQSLEWHNIDNFISLSSPQGGQYGDVDWFRHHLKLVKDLAYKFFYTNYGQKWSVGNYWNDPHHQDFYLEYSAFLAKINNQSSDGHSWEYRKNMLRLKNLIVIGGPDDEVITPWQSSQFAAFNDREQVVEMRDQEWYKNDWFGLKTLDNRKALHIYTEPHVGHHKWIVNPKVFKKYILPWLN